MYKKMPTSVIIIIIISVVAVRQHPRSSRSVGRSLVRVGNAIILLRLAVRNTGVIDRTRVDGIGALVVLDVAGPHQGGVEVVKGRVAVDLEGPVAANVGDGGSSGTEVAVKVLEVLCFLLERKVSH